jgi:hypothetical protein
MGGDHGPAIHGNNNNIKEEDSELSQKIRGIELIKHNPQMFYLNFYDVSNHFELAGGAKTAAFALLGGWIALSYFMGGQKTRPYNFYVKTHQGFGRFLFGAGLGGAAGFMKFGDRQKLHNAWVAERLRRRYPECMKLNATDLWQYKGVPAAHQFYQWR